MPILERVSEELRAAMRARDSVRRNALRNIRAAFLNEQKRDGSDELADEVCITLLRRLEKQRRESIEAFEGAGRDEQAAAERADLAVVQEFLPSLADEAQTKRWAEEAIESTGASSAADAGKVMGALMKSHRGDVDGALAKRIVAELLS